MEKLVQPVAIPVAVHVRLADPQFPCREHLSKEGVVEDLNVPRRRAVHRDSGLLEHLCDDFWRGTSVFARAGV